MKNTKIVIIVILAIILGLAGIIFYKSNSTKKSDPINPTSTPKSISVSENDPPQIVSTKPNPLEDNIVSASDIIEITFNRPLQNSGEFKLKIEPKIEVKIELSGDRKTAKIIPLTPYELGMTYTIFIGSDTKFDGIQNWGQDKTYHFKTVKYTGV